MKYKLENTKGLDLKSVQNSINSGAKFVLFSYRIRLVFVSILRLSPAIFIKKEDELDKYKSKYNMLNLIFGPWFLVKGPLLTYNVYKSNKNGGIDITKDIMLNLKETHLESKEVEILEIHNVFSKVLKSDKKYITKALQKVDSKLVSVKKSYAGLYINTDEEPYITIGIELNNDEELDINHIQKKLYSIYSPHVPFDIFDVSKNIPLAEKLIEQGEIIRN